MNPEKWKSIVISIQSYRKLRAMAKREMRTLSGQFTYILEQAVKEDERACEVFMTKRGKSGTELEATLYELGVLASKIMQENDLSGQKIDHLKKEVKSLKQALKALSA